jgi:hypothetical protein
MTIANMHSEFRILLDKGDSFDAPDFLPEEIDAFINMAISKFVTKRMFGNNIRRTNFEEDQKRRDDLRTLIVTSTLTGGVFVAGESKPNALFFELPENYRHTINEEALVEDRRVSVKPITHDHYNKIIDDPFNKPEEYTVYKLGYGGDGGSGSGYAELICGEGQTVSDYYLRYIRHAATVVLSDAIDCDLPELTHREIVRMAVVDALENVEQPRYQSSKMELNEIE